MDPLLPFTFAVSSDSCSLFVLFFFEDVKGVLTEVGRTLLGVAVVDEGRDLRGVGVGVLERTAEGVDGLGFEGEATGTGRAGVREVRGVRGASWVGLMIFVADVTVEDPPEGVAEEDNDRGRESDRARTADVVVVVALAVAVFFVAVVDDALLVEDDVDEDELTGLVALLLRTLLVPVVDALELVLLVAVMGREVLSRDEGMEVEEVEVEGRVTLRPREDKEVLGPVLDADVVDPDI